MTKLILYDSVIKAGNTEIIIINNCDDTHHDYEFEAKKFVDFLESNICNFLYSKILSEMFNKELKDDSSIKLTDTEKY